MKIKFDACVYKTQLTDHNIIKNRLLDIINKTPYQGVVADQYQYSSPKWGGYISRCDWEYSRDFDRPWYKLFRPNFNLSIKRLLNESYYDAPIDLDDIWFQQYNSGDSHGWHIHASQFTGVYYLEFPRGSGQTEILSPFSNKSRKMNVKEGDIIVFPSLWIHRATHNKVKRKTIISFNFNLDILRSSRERDSGGISYFQ